MRAIVVCVWHPETDELLFEAASATLTVETVRALVGPSFPQNPEMMAGYPVSAVSGRALLNLMGKQFWGEGEFHVSCEPLRATVVSTGRH